MNFLTEIHNYSGHHLKTPTFNGECSYGVLNMPTKLGNEILPMSICLLG